MIAALLSAALCLQAQAAPSSAPRQVTILVLPLEPRDGVSKDTAELTTSLLVARMRKVPGYQVMAYRDLEGALNMDMQRMRQDCNAISCAADIAGALNAEEVVMGSAGRLGPSVVISLTRIRQKNASVVGSWADQFEAADDSAMGLRVPAAVAELFPEHPELRLGVDMKPATSIQPQARSTPAPRVERTRGEPDDDAPGDEPEPLGRVAGITARVAGGGLAALGLLGGALGVMVTLVSGVLFYQYLDAYLGAPGPLDRRSQGVTADYAPFAMLGMIGGGAFGVFSVFVLAMGVVAVGVSVILLR